MADQPGPRAARPSGYINCFCRIRTGDAGRDLALNAAVQAARGPRDHAGGRLPWADGRYVVLFNEDAAAAGPEQE